jgi:nucleotidyltransferase substrate binding protein (TIGR01987 family)
MNTPDIRYLQRFENYKKALTLLVEACKEPPKSLLEQDGIIQRFEYTFELAWKTLQDLFIYRGYDGIMWPRLVIEQAFADEIIEDGTLWFAMLKSRNATTHTYDEEVVADILDSIFKRYLAELVRFAQIVPLLSSHGTKHW